MNLRLDIQGLRALAVIFVVIFHVQHQWFPGGFIGVDMFFVISGFLISKGMIKQIAAKSFSYVQFMMGRIKRIVPAYLVMLLMVAVPSYFILIPSDMLSFLYDLRTSLFFYSNKVFAEANNYFGARSYEKSLLHTWSLSIEMQFYFLLPILIYLIPKSLYKWAFGLGIVIILIYTQYQIDFLSNKTSMYFSLFARSAEFGVGILLNFLPNSDKVIHRNKNIFALVAIMVLVASGFIITENSSFPGFLAMPACLATGLLIWIGNSKVNKLLGTKALVYIGTLSYSLYLWHWPVLALYRYQAMRYDFTILEIVLLLVIIALLTLFSYYVIEEPFRKSSKKRVLLGVGSLSLLTFAFWYSGRKLTNDIQKDELIYTSANGFNLNNHAKYSGYFLMGHAKKADDHIVVIGDSHGLVMTGFMDEVGRKNDFNFSYISTNSIVPLNGIPETKIEKEYSDQYNVALPIVEELIQKSDIIIVVKHWQGSENAYFKDALQLLLNKLKPSQSLIVVTDFPGLERNPVREYKSIIKPAEFKKQKISFPKVPMEVSDLIGKYENAYLLDLKNEGFFESAPYFRDTLMYYDESHINIYGSTKFADVEGYKLANLIEQIKLKNK